MCTYMMTCAVENIIDIWDAYTGQRKGRFPYVSLNVVGMCFHQIWAIRNTITTSDDIMVLRTIKNNDSDILSV